MKRVLVIYYSQTGQLKKILDAIVAPLKLNQNIEIDICRIQLAHPFPFPWNRKSFFGAMPDSVSEIPHALKPLNLPPETNYDVIILGYQIWFLSPSIPINSFLSSTAAHNLLKGKKIITVCAGRNMWVMAHERIKAKLQQLQSHLVGHVALMDRSAHLVSVVTIIYWLFHGKTNHLLGIFPKPGVQPQEFEKCNGIGKSILKALTQSNYSQLQAEIVEQKGVFLSPSIISMETKAKKVFKIWVKVINAFSKMGNWGRILGLTLFEFYLYFVILFLSPVISIFSTFASIFRRKATERKLAYYSGVQSK